MLEKDRDGRTEVHHCAFRNDASSLQALVAAGAAYGNTPLGTAVFNYRGNGTIIELLLAHGADPDEPNHHGKTPRYLAHLIANTDVRKYFP